VKNNRGKLVTDTVWHKVKNISFTNQLGQKVSLDDLHGKIVGIFIELDDNILMRLLQDDNYFHTQVMVTVKELREKIGNA